jgi:hypothetical protein
MNAPASFLEPLLAHALVVDWKAHGLHKRPHRARRVRVTEKKAVNACGQRLLEHPGISSDRGFIRSMDWYVDDHGGHPMPGSGRTTGRKTPHVLRQGLDRVRRMLSYTM